MTRKVSLLCFEETRKTHCKKSSSIAWKTIYYKEDLPLQQVDYSYNVRGWLKAINDTANLDQAGDPQDLFAFRLSHEDPETAQVLFNGNISETFWRTASDNTLRKYAYQYDNLNRLRSAYYQKPGGIPGPDSYGESQTYDKNGNILTLERFGEFDDPVVALSIDQLVYKYAGQSNKLLKVSDETNNPHGFRDDSDGFNDDEDDYTYDANGNMTSDQNKEIRLITYNHLDLPVKISFEANSIEYLYNANGRKLKKTITAEPIPQKTQEYLGRFIYSDGVLEVISTAEGYVKNTVINDANKYNYVFNYTDHLGNVRLSYSQKLDARGVEILEENNYYPFGLKHRNYNMGEKAYIKSGSGVVLDEICADCPLQYKYNYKYNGKEWQDELGLNWYDYEGRNYDPAIGRWMNIDPLAEQSRRWSPYNYAYNNPIYFIDPDGMQARGYEDFDEISTIDLETSEIYFAKPPVGVIQENGTVYTDDEGTWIYDSDSNTWEGQNGVENVSNEILLQEVIVEGGWHDIGNYSMEANEDMLELLAIPLVVSQLDSPMVGPADVVALIMVIAIVDYYYGPKATTIGLYHEMA